MSKKLLAVIIMVFISVTVYGNGGPIIGISYTGLGNVNEYTQSFGIPPFETHCYTIGGMGTNWFSKTFGVGFLLCGGAQMKFKEGFNSYASLYKFVGLLDLENTLYEKNKFILNIKFGPGFLKEHLFIVNTGTQAEFAIESILFHFDVGIQLKLSEVTKIELSWIPISHLLMIG